MAPLYTPAVTFGGLVFLSGQVPRRDGAMLATGRLGDDVSLEAGRECARQCAVNLLELFERTHGTTDAIAQVLKLTVFVAATPSFTEHPEVADAASATFIEALGEQRGGHARSAVGVASLPRGVPVEVEAVIALDGIGTVTP